ncbi:hypothetical protein PAN31117_04322 [Pandoraea anapnoica]|uniref:PBCV-specific basic adaptor domain-containing protein n=1 Tax=Pandoraea anapnoica TaxID=2508301 RepID=A0A5E5AI31_9BURK|nr:hypothetical protein PAN31117_04322 [Pandoraea anapnoica]
MRLSLLFLAMCVSAFAHAANYPCSGSKGGIERCVGEQFLCRDGSISASKRICSMPGTSAPALSPKTLSWPGNDDCTCRSGTYCTGPRGGTFCYADGGKKSYFRK